MTCADVVLDEIEQEAPRARVPAVRPGHMHQLLGIGVGGRRRRDATTPNNGSYGALSAGRESRFARVCERDLLLLR
jgi:hypothetical protein